MRLSARHGLYGFLAACAVVTIALLMWPAKTSAPPATHVETYRGPEAKSRRGGPLSGFPVRLTSGDAVLSVAAPAEAAPVLVGLAGRNAYLRSQASGEVERVAVGQSLNGWRLVSLDRRGAVLRGANGDQRVDMFAVEAASPSVDGALAVGPSASPDTAPAAPADLLNNGG